MNLSRSIRRLAVLCLLLSGLAAAHAGMVNGDFEMGSNPGPAAGWTDYDSTFGYNRCSLSACPNGRQNYISSGDYWLWFGGALEEQFGVAFQTSVIEVGTTTLSFDFWAFATAGPAVMILMMDGDELWKVYDTDAPRYASGYSTQNVSVSNWADGKQHSFGWKYRDLAAGLDTSWFVDNARFDTPQIGNLPEPGTLMLAGFGLVAAGWRRAARG